MSTFKKVSAFDEVFTFACGRHSVICEFSDSFKMKDRETGEFKQKNGCDILYKNITFYDVEDKTKTTARFSDGQIYYFLKGLVNTHEALEGKKQSEIIKYLAENAVDVYVTKHPQYGKQFSAYAPKEG